MANTRVAIVGYGNIGKFAFEAIMSAPDMELVGVVRKASEVAEGKPAELNDIPVVSNIDELSRVQVALICTPTRIAPDYAKELLSRGINTVDSYDIHGNLADHRQELQIIAEKHQAVSVISAGWDPGTDSIIRCLFEFMTPKGLTHTNFGPGMSMGHSVVAKSINGVKNALSLTIPVGTGIHRRMVYVELEPEAVFTDIETAIKNDPYFINDETYVKQVEDVNKLLDMGHGVSLERKGVSGLTHNQRLKFDMRINNPALTAQIMVAAARASLKQKPGSYTLIQIPIIDFIYGDPDEIIRKLV